MPTTRSRQAEGPETTASMYVDGGKPSASSGRTRRGTGRRIDDHASHAMEPNVTIEEEEGKLANEPKAKLEHRRPSRGVVAESKHAAADEAQQRQNEEQMDYERIREENIRRNQEFLRNLGLEGVRADISVATAVAKQRREVDRITQARRGKRGREEESSTVVRRSSRVAAEAIRGDIGQLLRAAVTTPLTPAQEEELKGLEARLQTEVGEGAALGMIASAQDEDLKPRRQEGPELPLRTVSDMATDTLEAAHSEVVALLGGLNVHHGRPGKRHDAHISRDQDRYHGFGKGSDYEFVAVSKTTSGRITTMYLHPSDHKLIAVAGDKSGNVGIWDIDASNHDMGEEEKVYYYKPFASNVCAASASLSDPSRLWLASYDGTVRCLDVGKEALVLGFKTPKEEFDDGDSYLTDVAFAHQPLHAAHGEHVAYLARSDGVVAGIDLRTGSSNYTWTHQTTSVKVNSVQIHPLDANVLVCGGGGRARNISILDIRVISGSTNLSGGRTSGSKKGLLCDLLGHTAAINAAYVSPDGSSLVSVALDDTVALWSADMSIKTGDAGLVAPTSFTLAHSMRHNNKTGRWLSTLRPAFDPKCARTFVLGSLEMPRRIEVYDIEMGSSASKGIANKTTSKGSSSSLPLSMHDRPVLQDQQLESVCSRNAVHPSLRVVAGGNSSGRVHVFREKK